MNRSLFSSRLLAASCVGMLLTGAIVLSGCGGGGQQAEKKEDPLLMESVQVDQLSRIHDKVADGQYWVVKVVMKNLSNSTMVMNPPDFFLQNITDKPEEQFSQPAEKFMTQAFTKQFGDTLKDKLVDFNPTNLYPRLQVERYFVFMVPADAKADQYQIQYKPAKVAAPLVTSATVVNDHRNDAPAQ